MSKNFFNLGKEREIKAQEAQRVPNTMNLKKNTLRHIIKW